MSFDAKPKPGRPVPTAKPDVSPSRSTDDVTAPTVQVDQAENVNVPGEAIQNPLVIRLVLIVTVGVLLGFGWVTFAVLNGDAGAGIDAATKGSIIQTWNNLAVAAAAVWTTSSIVGRIKSGR